MWQTKTVCSECCKMMPLCWCILLLCLSVNARKTALYREPGCNITLECSSAGYPSGTDEYFGMYLYRKYDLLEEVLYYHSTPETADKITPRQRYKNRIQTKGSLKNHNITISNLTVDDAGIYRCVYMKSSAPDGVKCNVYLVFVRGECCDPANEKGLPLVLVIIVTCAITALVTMIILLIVPMVKKWTSNRKRRTTVPQVTNDYVYEVMTINGFRPLACPEQ